MDPEDAKRLKAAIRLRDKADAKVSSIIRELIEQGTPASQVAEVLGWSRQRLWWHLHKTEH